MRNVMKLLTRLFNQTLKTTIVQRQVKSAILKPHHQAYRTWRFVGNQSIKSNINGKIVHKNAKFFVPKTAVYTAENIGKKLEKFTRYVESKGFKLSFDFVKLALVGLALNHGENQPALDALRHSFSEVSQKSNGLEEYKRENNLLHHRKLDNGYEEVYTRVNAEEVIEDEEEDEDEARGESSIDRRLEENGMLVTFENEDEDEDPGEKLAHLLLSYLEESNSILRQSQQNIEVLRRQRVTGEALSDQLGSDGGFSSVGEENGRLKVILSEKEKEIAELKKEIEMLKREGSGDETDTHLLQDEDTQSIGEVTYRRGLNRC